MSSRQVTLDGGSPWGFRMHGGADAQLPLRIARVNPGSKAAVRGIREGDLISSINGRATGGLSNAEAHALLRSAQDTLTLGLNQGVTGSPKRRSQKLAQEIKEENLKRTSVTSSSSSISNVSTIIHTVSNSQHSNESAHTNGVDHSRTDNKTEESKSETLSNYTSYIKNGSPFSTPHGATNDIEKSRDARDDTVTQHTTPPASAPASCNESAATAAGDDSVIAAGHDKALLAAVIMADNVSASSRSRKQRRSRSNRKKSKKAAAAAVTSTDSAESVVLEDSAPAPYKVEFPNTTTTTEMVEKKSSTMVKSRSLDDDDHVKITEVTEEEKTACLSESTAIVSEAESDVEWETVSELEMHKETSAQHFGKLSVISLPLAEHVTYETSHISPEDEQSLRDFLEGLNLVNSPEESAQRIEKTSGDSVKTKKAKKRAVLAQHFLPYYQNPRYLDVISEEGSDLSDRDSKQNTPFVCRVLDYNDDDEDDVFEDADVIKQKKLRNKFQTHFAGVNDGAILVGTKIIENNNIDTVIVKEATWTTSMAETQSGAEVVYLEDSSNSMTPSDLLDLEDTAGDLDADDEEDISLDLDRTCSESLDIDLNSSETCSLMKPDITITSSSDTASRASLPTDSDQTKSESAPAATPPPTPDTLANDSAQMPPIPPPPTATNKTIDFLQKLLFTLSNNNTNDILMTLNEQEAQHLPLHIKNKLKTFTESQDSTNKTEIVGDINNFKNLISRENSEEKNSTCDKETSAESKDINDSNEINVERNSPQITTRDTSIEKCSENEEELNKELKNLCECLQKPSEENSKRSESASTSVSRSDSASSARSSQCTAVYNPLHSSLSNIAALLREGSYDASEPPPLREMCVRTLLAMPFGKDVIEELANVSQSIEEMTCRTPSRTHSVPTPAPSTSPRNSTDIDASSVLPVPVDSPVVRSAMDAERWVGMPTEENPNLLVCLSPAQKEFIDKTKTIPNEASSLLDLHRKFIERRGYHEEFDLLTTKTTKDVPAFKIEVDNNPIKNNLLKIIQDSSKANNNDITNISVHNTSMNYNDYVKQFTREIPIQILKSNEPEQRSTSGNIRYDTYIKQLVREVPIQVEKQINKPVNNKIYRDAPAEPRQVQEPRVHGDRLRARHLGEWLNLARNECDKINNLSEHANRVHNLQSPVNKLVSQHSCEERFSHVSNASFGRGTSPRRYSLPFNLYEQQMQYILEKEREVQQEIEKLKEEKSKLEKDMAADISSAKTKEFDAGKYQISRKGDIAILHSETEKPLSKVTPSPSSEKFREQMYNEYMCKVAERQERKQNKVIKIKISTEEHHSELSPQYEAKQVYGIEDEFMTKVRERKGKLGLMEEESEDQAKTTAGPGDAAPVKVLDGEALADAALLPKHLQEFIDIANSAPDDGVWTPSKGVEPEPAPRPAPEPAATTPAADKEGDEPAPVVWTPRSAGSSPTAERKEFRPVNFESPVLRRKNYSQPESSGAATPEGLAPVPPPWNSAAGAEERRLTSSQSAPAAGLTSLGKLPRAQNPTITLLQKAREGQLPRGASYIEEPQAPTPRPRSKDSRPPLIGPNEIPVYTVKHEYISESDSEKPKKMADLGPRKFEGIGPTTKDGMPIVLRSIYDEQEVKDSNQAKWYKRMYDTLHRSRNDDEYVTVRYKTRRGRYPYTSAGGYLSEPEPNAYDSDVGVSASKYATLDRRRLQTGRDKENEYITYTVPRNKYMSASVRHSTDVYKNQPGRIENYVPGHSSISEKEAKEWWDEVMEIFDGWLDDHSALPSLNYMLSQVTARSHLEQQKHVPPPSKSYMSHALKESGYESDSTLVFRRREDAALQLSPHEQKEAYKSIQKGGEVPLHGLRKPAPERPKDDSEIEYFPISPTLTRIRVHKNVKPINEILCYPITVHHQPPQVFSAYKRTAPSSSTSQPLKPPPRPPSPPKRRSSRNSHTLRLISTMTIHRAPSPKSSRRHETCFKSSEDKSNVKFLRDRISCKLKSPSSSKKGVKITKTISTYPSSSKESITTTVSSGKEASSKIKTKTEVTSNYSRSTASSAARRCCRHCSFSVPPKMSETVKPSDKIKNRAVSLERTFGSEKRKVDLTLPKVSTDSRYKLVKSPDLVSPSEVKKGVEKQRDILNIEKYPPGTTVKKSTSMFSSAKNGMKGASKQDEKSLNVTVAFTARGKELLNSSVSSKSSNKPSKTASPVTSRTSRNIASSPVPSNISERSKISNKSRTISTESLRSPTIKKRSNIKPVSISRTRSTNVLNKEEVSSSDRDKKRNKKIKKDQSNEELKKDKKSQKFTNTKVTNNEKNKTKKCVGRATGAEIANKLKEMENMDIMPQPADLIKKQHDEIGKSDTFFQNLFLRNMLSSPTPSTASKTSYILERTKMLQNHQYAPVHAEPTTAALKVYLSHRKPVSESKFKTMDREMSIRSRSASPCGFSNIFSGRRARFDSISEVSNESHGSRHLSPESIYSKRSSSLPATKIVFSETSRPVSPSLEKSLVSYGYRSPSPSPIRSPSRRKIRSIRPPATITVEGISGIKKKALRARSAGEAESLKRELYYMENPLTPSVSSLSLSQLADPQEYKTYVSELRHSAKKSDRFKELNRFYSSLERLSQLERTTSSTDLRPRRRNEEEIIDYDRWMQVRTRERAEQEFNILYRKLKQEQREKDLLFKTKDVENFRWKYDREFGLKIKEHSVENIKEQFEKLKDNESPLEISKRRILNYQKDVYKPLWRGNSVVNLVSKISEKRSQSESRIVAAKQKYLCAERLLNREIGSKLWSSLSVEQVNALKNQLAEIYSTQASPEKRDDYSINVDPQSKNGKPKTLVIRRNSANELTHKEPQMRKRECVKSASIGSISPGSQTLSENEKKRLSLSLSREVQDRMSQRQKYKSSMSIVLGKETRGAIAAAEAKIKPSIESTSPRTCYSLEPTEDDVVNKPREDKNFLLVLTKDDSEEQKQNVSQTLDEWAQPKTETSIVPSKKIASTSETESASSDTSTKTAIFVGKKEDLHKKIEYFEKSANVETYVPTIYRPAEDDEDVTDMVPMEEPHTPIKETKRSSNLVSSQSYADLKELFGEKELMKFATVPLSATRKSSSTSPKRPLLRVTNFSPVRTVSEASSYESIVRSRSISPDTDRFWNAYLTLVKGVDVHKMTKKFEHLKDFYSNREVSSTHRRCKSDSELTSFSATDERDFGDVYWLKKRYENLSRGRSRTRKHDKISPIAKTSFKGDDRLMPHINIISKLASLYPKKQLQRRETSVEELARALGCPVGEVEKMREKFESPERDVSLLGHMFTSSPNVHELRDIAPYLAGSWIAHRYPKFQDNSRSASAPEENGTNKALVRKDRPRPKSASPPRSKKQPSSILKSHPYQSHRDVFANQRYEPSIHRPLYRYQPPPSSAGRGRTRSWSPVAKHTVTFKEPVLGIAPPPREHHDNRLVGPESPRKYVEDEVTIHYRSPVRHEVKEALSEEELARRQAEAMRRIYQEERRRKYLQELQDMNSRRHTDNFIPSQKSPIPLNRYDDFGDDLGLKPRARSRSPEPRIVARALYNFVGQSARELTFRKGDVIFIRRQVDKNWFEGEHNAMLGLFPSNYVEIIPYDGIKSTPRKANEGQARAKFNFIAQTHLELSLAKGELVVLTRRVDDNWFEGRIGSRKGIFPVSYVEVLIDPGDKPDISISSTKPVASPAAHSLLLNGSAGGKESMGSHHYQPSYTSQQTTTSYHAKPVNVIGTSTSYSSLTRTQKITAPSVNEALHIDTQSEPVPYRALYKYRPQNDDELELQEGDTVFVLEKCDDGWFVGSSQRTGSFGTFPGNYVERI